MAGTVIFMAYLVHVGGVMMSASHNFMHFSWMRSSKGDATAVIAKSGDHARGRQWQNQFTRYSSQTLQWAGKDGVVPLQRGFETPLQLGSKVWSLTPHVAFYVILH